jgi:hypothetical protein
MRWLKDSAASILQLGLGVWREYKERLKSFRPGHNSLSDRGTIADLEAAVRFNWNAVPVLNECHSKDGVVCEWQN